MEAISMKKCSSCGRTLPLHAFSPDKRNKDGTRGICRECISAKKRERNLKARMAKNPSLDNEAFKARFLNPVLQEYIKTTSRIRGRNDPFLSDEMEANAWERLAFFRRDATIQELKRQALLAIEGVRKKAWEYRSMCPLSFDESIESPEPEEGFD
jgi:recombinational DNA repair protein (RecF pathway)